MGAEFRDWLLVDRVGVVERGRLVGGEEGRLGVLVMAFGLIISNPLKSPPFMSFV